MHGTLGMLNCKGRKRKSGRRTAGGRPVERRHDVDYRALVSAQPHRNWLPEALRSDERAENVIGCLFLLKRISEEMYEAGRRFSVIVGSFRQVIGAPRGSQGSGRGYKCEPSACAKDPGNCLCAIRTDKYRDATGILQSAGQKAYNITYQVAIADMVPAAEQLEDLRCGLYALAEGFGLTRRGK